MKYAISLLPVLSCFWLTSCQQKLYFPDRANTPCLSELYETKLTLAVKPQNNYTDSLHGNGGVMSFGADIAFAPLEHLGIIASYRSVNHRRIDEGSFLDNVYGGVFTGHRWEGGLGYWTAFGRMGRAEVYGGYGQGLLERKGYYTPERDFTTNYRRFFLQPAAGVGNDHFAVTGGFRIAFQKYYSFSSPNDPLLRYHILNEDGSMDVENETIGFIEPFINGEVGWKYIRFNLQLGATAQYIGPNVSGNLPLYISMGLVFDLAPSFLKTSVGKVNHKEHPVR